MLILTFLLVYPFLLDERTPSPKPTNTNRFSSVNNNTNGSHCKISFMFISRLIFLSHISAPPSTTNNENKPKNPNQRSSNPPHISTEDESEGDAASVSDESPSPETKRFSHATTSHQRHSFSD